MSTSKYTIKDYQRRICSAMNYISKNLDRDLELDEIAQVAAFSKYHFHRIFKAVVGETVSGFTRRLRLEWAANMLLSDTHHDITRIAMECGFSSSQNFAKAFRKHFGISPSIFRKRKSGNKNSKEGKAISIRAHYDASVFSNSSMNERSNDMNAEVKEMPEFHVAYVRKLGRYGKNTSQQAFGELIRWAGPKGYLESGTVLGIYWDNPEVTPPAKCRVDACVSVPKGTHTEGQIDLQTIAGGPYAVCHFEIEGDNFTQAWDDAFHWLINSGHQCDDKPCYELYHDNVESQPKNKWKVDICIPLKR